MSESLEAELARCRRLIDIYRQQRDAALSAANDLHAQLALLREKPPTQSSDEAP